jgi:hypothetical protein
MQPFDEKYPPKIPPKSGFQNSPKNLKNIYPKNRSLDLPKVTTNESFFLKIILIKKLAILRDSVYINNY